MTKLTKLTKLTKQLNSAVDDALENLLSVKTYKTFGIALENEFTSSVTLQDVRLLTMVDERIERPMSQFMLESTIALTTNEEQH